MSTNVSINAKRLRGSLPEVVQRVRKGTRFTVIYRSRPAFQIVPVGDGNYSLRDLGSANGTLVNTRTVRETVLLRPIRPHGIARPWARSPAFLATRADIVGGNSALQWRGGTDCASKGIRFG